jgi:hypothetical protein
MCVSVSVCLCSGIENNSLVIVYVYDTIVRALRVDDHVIVLRVLGWCAISAPHFRTAIIFTPIHTCTPKQQQHRQQDQPRGLSDLPDLSQNMHPCSSGADFPPFPQRVPTPDAPHTGSGGSQRTRDSKFQAARQVKSVVSSKSDSVSQMCVNFELRSQWAARHHAGHPHQQQLLHGLFSAPIWFNAC